MSVSRVVVAAARLLTPAGLRGPGWVRVHGGHLVEVSHADESALPSSRPAAAPDPGRSDPVVDLGEVVLAPGFVDTHCHGGGGAAFADGPDAARQARATHLAHGTTTTMASLVTDTVDALAHQVEGLAPLVASGELMGVHLEGPWLSPCHAGAHDRARLLAPTPRDLDRLLGTHPGAVRMVTLAPELPGGLDAVQRCARLGVVAALGHSDAGHDLAGEALARGATVATHLFNAMRPLHHREPGVAGACLDRPGTALELICDGVHVHPAVTRLVAGACPERLVLVTDAMAAAGSSDGRYRLGGLDVQVTDGVARLVEGGAIAGSTLTLDRAVRHAVQVAGVPLETALRAATSTPARVHRLLDRGVLAAGTRADLVALDADLHVRAVMLAGRWLGRPA